MTTPREAEKKKRRLFIGVEVAGIATTVLVTPWLGVPLIGAGLYLGWDWFQHRAKNGMKF